MLRALTTTTSPSPELMAGWPDWLVIVAAVAGVIAGIWILGKLLKLALWLLLVAMLAAGVLTLVGFLLR